MSLCRKRSKGRALQHPELGEGEIKLNDSDAEEEEVVEINNAHRELVKATRKYQLSKKLQREYCNRLKRIIKWIFIFYWSHYDAIYLPITPEQRNDPLRMYHKMEEDINYSLLNKDIFEAFLVEQMTKSNGKQCSFSHIRKFFDALLYGARQSQHYLSSTFCTSIETFLECVSKRVIKEKRGGNTDEKDADSVSKKLYEHICKWALECNNCFIWSYTVMLWNCMARSASIEVIGLHNMYMGSSDSVYFCYDDSKTDKTGKKVSHDIFYF